MNLNSYNDFSDETKKFLNKAMDVYSTIKEIDINQKVRSLVIIEEDYQFTKLDKKVLSLFIAGFLVDGNLKQIFEEYDDIKLQDFLSFVKINENQIRKLGDDEYADFYSKNFKLDIINILKEGMVARQVNYITPEVIISCFRFVGLSGSRILDYFREKYKITGLFFSDHPLFKALENYTLIDGSVSDKHSPKRKGVGTSSSLLDLATDMRNIPRSEEQLSDKQTSTSSFIDESVWELLDEIQKKFIGQETAAEGLFYNIVNNQQLAQMEEIPDGQRSIIFVDGPTGTGKTAITREITEKLGVPLVATSVTNYSSVGYKGGDFTDILESLYEKADGDLEKAQRGIVVLDEFDKIISSKDSGLEMKKAVQQQLLDFLGGGKYTIRVGESIFNMTKVEFDTSKLTFVCLDALTDLRDKKTETRYLGFGDSKVSNAIEEYSITPQDLIDIGFERELVGRFNTYLHTEEYSKETLLKILKESPISPLIGFRKLIESRGKKLEIDDGVYEAVAEAAYELNTGARSLQTIMNNIRTYYLKEVLRGKDEVIRLDLDTVISINHSTISRKARR